MPLVRLNADGSLDFSYISNPQFSSSDIARDLILQPDGKAVAAITSSVYRLDTTGLVDSTFTRPYFWDTTYDPFGNAGTSTTVNLQPDGRMIVGGIFTNVNPPDEPDGSHFGVVRLNSDGTVDSTFVTNHRTGLEDFPSSFARLSDGSVLTAFRTQSIKHDPAMHYNLGRLLPNGSLDADFSLSSSDPGGILSMDFVANDFIQLLDGEFFVFDRYGRGGKFLVNGVQDPSFQLNPYGPYFQEGRDPPRRKSAAVGWNGSSGNVICRALAHPP